jgi:hypothetical protein
MAHDIIVGLDMGKEGLPTWHFDRHIAAKLYNNLGIDGYPFMDHSKQTVVR